MIPSELGLLAKFLPTLKDAMSFSLTSKGLYDRIHSEEFFNIFVHEMDPDHPYFRSSQERKEGLLRHRFLDLRCHFSCKTEPLLDLPVCNLSKSNADYFVIVEGLKVLVHTADKKTCLATYEIDGEICQLHLQGHSLFIVEQDLDNVCYLVTYNLKQLQEAPTHSILPGAYTTPLGFQQYYCIYVEYFDKKDTAYAITYSHPNSWVKIMKSEGFLYYFPTGDHFIEVKFEGKYLSLFKKNYFTRKPIIEDLKIPLDDLSIEDVHFHNNRLVFSCKISDQQSKLFCYDLELYRLIELTTVPQGEPFPCFMSTAEKTYYLATQLTTITFGKI